jgi:cyclic-di-AMP phosphodiesterase PgpH
MGILEQLGLARKSRKGAPHIGEKKKKEQEDAAKKKKIYVRGAILLGFIAILVYALPETTYRQVASYTIGEPWRADDLTAPITFALKKSEAELEEERNEIRENTPAIFHLNENAHSIQESRIDSLYRSLEPVLDSYVQWQRAKQDPDVSAENDSIRFVNERDESGINLSDSSWELLLDNYATIQFEGRSAEEFIGNRIRPELENLTERMLNEGLIDVSKDDVASNEIALRNLSQRTERKINIQNVRDLPGAREYAGVHFLGRYNSQYEPLVEELFDEVITPNWLFSSRDTQARLDEALADISETKGAVVQGEVIIRRGDIVTEERANVLRSLAEARADAATDFERWSRFGGEVILLIIASLFFLSYLYLYRRKIFENNSMFLLVFLVLGIVTLASGLIHDFDIPAYIVPIAVAPLILTIIFDSRVGLLAAVTLAIITAIYHDNHFEYLIATILACSFGIFSVRDINKRAQFFVTTPLVVFAGYLLVVTGFALTRFSGWDMYFGNLFFIAINCVFILFTYPLILIFEKTFNITTDFTLLELGDTNLPLLKDLMNKAPGTFHHSLQVANLAESGAAAIGANALLCRVGALYHDIGKMNKPGYFIENQTGKNEHDKLKPRMSALIIKAHVSDGVKMAEENDLPEKIIEFIRTHHGTSLIRFFYDRAQKLSDNDTEVREEDFRYDGPIPGTKETGILLLADSIEAASRSMKDPTYNKLENLINRMVDDHVYDGQLNHCPLTFDQLDTIKKTFLNILIGVYHSRVEYPEEKKEKEKTDSEKESATSPENDQTVPDNKAEQPDSPDHSDSGYIESDHEEIENPDKPD